MSDVVSRLPGQKVSRQGSGAVLASGSALERGAKDRINVRIRRTMVSRFPLSLALPYGSKVPNYRLFRVSILGIVMMVLGRYLIVEYLDPQG